MRTFRFLADLALFLAGYRAVEEGSSLLLVGLVNRSAGIRLALLLVGSLMLVAVLPVAILSLTIGPLAGALITALLFLGLIAIIYGCGGPPGYSLIPPLPIWPSK